MLPKSSQEFKQAVMILFSTAPEAWMKFEDGLKECGAWYAKQSAKNHQNPNFQQQLLGKFDMCDDLSDYRKRIEEESK